MAPVRTAGNLSAQFFTKLLWASSCHGDGRNKVAGRRPRLRLDEPRVGSGRALTENRPRDRWLHSRRHFVPSSPKPGSFEDFVRWLGEARRPAAPDAPEPSAEMRDAARLAWREFHAVRRSHRQALVARVRGGTYFEELELLAA